MSVNFADARRFRAMSEGFRDRGRGLPREAMPPGLAPAEREWWLAGWRWRDDQLEIAARDREIGRLRAEIETLKGGAPS
jgi:ribosome modulation factor